MFVINSEHNFPRFVHVIILSSVTTYGKILVNRLQRLGFDCYTPQREALPNRTTLAFSPRLIVWALSPFDDVYWGAKWFQAWPNVPVLLCQPYKPVWMREVNQQARTLEIVANPYDREAIVQKIHQMIDGSETTGYDGLSMMQYGDMILHQDTRMVQIKQNKCQLSHQECRLLEVLIRSGGDYVTSRDLLLSSWGPGAAHHPEYVRIYARRLRLRLSTLGLDGYRLIESSSAGYRLNHDAVTDS
ncbi:MAG: winged helix-turn-helix domain-containing protein [Firmicutes bacterium]|nr:winged helix-turn-helix domain-containing protein [Bacillota bacterium]